MAWNQGASASRRCRSRIRQRETPADDETVPITLRRDATGHQRHQSPGLCLVPGADAITACASRLPAADAMTVPVADQASSPRGPVAIRYRQVAVLVAAPAHRESQPILPGPAGPGDCPMTRPPHLPASSTSARTGVASIRLSTVKGLPCLRRTLPAPGGGRPCCSELETSVRFVSYAVGGRGWVRR